jgi:hypothetical protein
MFLRVLLKLVRLALGLALIAGIAFGGWWQWRNKPVQAADYHLRGKFGPVQPWPLIPIHVNVLPDGRVLSYGSDAQGKQGALAFYDIWDPRKGFGKEAHLVLPNTIGSDIFCSGQIVIPSKGEVLLVGGDRTVNGKRNWSSPDINLIDLKTGVLRSTGRTMERPRWYPTVMTLANGEVLILGGRMSLDNHFAPLPEIYSPTKGWRTLPGADKDFLFGSANWNYPRAWQTPRGDVFSLSRTGEMHTLKLEGEGSYAKLPQKIFRGHSYLPSLMYAPGKILSIRLGGMAYDIDINQPEPSIRRAAWSPPLRFNATATVMADGKVYLGGGALRNDDAVTPLLSNRVSEIWDPAQNKWQTAAVAAHTRLYHSSALLMQDGTILTGGGGAGRKAAENHLDVETYYPPYLFKTDGSGELAPRPTLIQAPDFIAWDKAFKVETQDTIQRFTLVKMGAATHAQVFDQRFLDVKFTKTNKGYELQGPASALIAPPGYYFLFAFNGKGVPSVAKIVRLDTASS